MAIVSFFDQFPEFDGIVIQIRNKDGYFDASAMSKVMGKRFNDWTKTKFAQRLLARLSQKSGIPIDYEHSRSQNQTPLIDYVRGGTRGIWLHPYVAMSYAMALPEFQAEVNMWIVDLLTLGTINPHLLQWTKEEYLRGVQFNRDDISEMYGDRD